MSVTRIIDGFRTEFATEEEASAAVWKDMVTSRRAPGQMGGNTGFMRGKSNNEDFAKLPDFMRKHYLREAKAAGVDITGKTYHHGIARFPCDPHAWISSDSDLKTRAEARGVFLEGDTKDLNFAPSKAARERREKRIEARHAQERRERAAERKAEEKLARRKQEKSA